MNKKKRNIIIFSCLGLIIVILIIIIVLKLINTNNNKLTKEQEELKTFGTNTSISSENVESYRAKVSIRNLNDEKNSINYVIYNKGNSEYEISFIGNEDKFEIISIKNKKDKEKLEYDYTNTDIFLDGLEKGTDIKSEKETIGEDVYTIYSFNVNKDVINNILNGFDIETKFDGNGKVYIDKDNRVYLIIYNTEDINISVSYTRIEEK